MTHVWVVTDGRISRRPVELGRSAGVQALVTAGLEAGERVVNTQDLELRERLEDGLTVEVAASGTNNLIN